MPPLPANGDLNSHTELSACRSPRMSVMLVCDTTFVYQVLVLPVPKIWLKTALMGLVNLTFDLEME